MTKKQLQYQITHNILGYSSLGFFDFENDPAGWQEFAKTYFFREGEIDGHKYTSDVNKHVSGAAMLQTLDEVKKQIDKLFEGIEKLEE